MLSMRESRQSFWNFPRALWATSLCAVLGGITPVVLALVIACCRWIAGPSETASEWFRSDLEENLVYPVVGCAVVCSCAGWATFAPAGKHSFTWSLAFMFFVSLVLWAVGGWMELTPRRYKGIEHPVFYVSELIAMIGPPIAAATFLTLFRTRRVPTSDASSAP